MGTFVTGFTTLADTPGFTELDFVGFTFLLATPGLLGLVVVGFIFFTGSLVEVADDLIICLSPRSIISKSIICEVSAIASIVLSVFLQPKLYCPKLEVVSSDKSCHHSFLSHPLFSKTQQFSRPSVKTFCIIPGGQPSIPFISAGNGQGSSSIKELSSGDLSESSDPCEDVGPVGEVGLVEPVGEVGLVEPGGEVGLVDPSLMSFTKLS